LASYPAPSSSPYEPPSPIPPADPFSPAATGWERVRSRRLRPSRRGIHLALFLATLISTTLVGAEHYRGFLSDFATETVGYSWIVMAGGLWYSLTILAILGAHEMGHYLACRHYDIDATLPYFLPAPLLTGTFGAVIRIREAFPTKAILFDIGVAGPIAGFVVAVPALFMGLLLSRLVPLPPDFVGYSLGEPLLFRLASWLIWGPVPEGYSLSLHPVGFAAWFGLIATALNLIPFGQLDGGHISYAALGHRSTTLSLVVVLVAVVLTFFSLNWLIWVIIMLVMLLITGPRHPRVVYEHLPLDPGRQRVALAAVAMFVLCFTPVPIEPYELIR
jgi:hypothetical protein